MKLELGGGHLCQEGWVNLDPVPSHATDGWCRYAQDVPWPTGDNTVEAIKASHVLEHIPAGQPRIDVFNEAHRVLAPGGMFEVVLPLFIPGTWQALADPTHVSLWVRESFHYFTGALSAQADYGLRYWAEVSWEVVGDWEGHWIGTPR